MQALSIEAASAAPWAVVTGASAGIGAAFARRLAQDGFRVALVARDASRLQTLAQALPGTGHIVVAADLSTPGGVEQIAAWMAERPVRLLVNNAGCGRYGAYHGQPLEALRPLWRLNCAAVARLAHAFLQQARPGDALVNVSSIMAFLPQPTVALYSATKAFVTALSEALWYENAPRGVYVMGLHPGMTRTEFRGRAGGEPVYGRGAHRPETVVAIAMRHLARRRRSTVVCGGLNTLLCILPRLLSRRAVVSLLGRLRSVP
jgi:short-subunit dehydrogenase